MTTPGRSRRTRLIATASAAALLGGGVFIATTAQAAPALPAKTAEQLLVDVQSPTTDTWSGTVRSSAELGLPELPQMGEGGSDELTGLMAGDNTLRVWVDGSDRSRLALVGDNQETTLVRNGTEAWAWSSADRTATHAVMPAHEVTDKPRPEGRPATPQEAAEQVLAALDPTTEVSTSGTARVAGRPAYELVLTPAATEDTLVREVRLAIDAETHLVLDVRVLGTGSDEPALQVGFSKIDYATPDADLFTFTPPAGATVEEFAAPLHEGSAPAQKTEGTPPTVVGEGWDAVVVTTMGTLPTEMPTADDPEAGQAMALLESLPQVSGDWGSGRLLTGTVFSAVLTDDGRVASGAVPPERLYDALR